METPPDLPVDIPGIVSQERSPSALPSPRPLTCPKLVREGPRGGVDRSIWPVNLGVLARLHNRHWNRSPHNQRSFRDWHDSRSFLRRSLHCAPVVVDHK